VTKLLLDFSLRTKAGPRVAQGLISPLLVACQQQGWDVDVIVAPGRGGTDGPGRQAPDRSDLFLEEVWLPRLARRYDAIYTQREGLRLPSRRAAHVLQLHEHQQLRYASWSSLRSTARGAWQRHRASQMYDGADGICFSSDWTRNEFIRLEGREPPISTVAHLAGWPDNRISDRPLPKEHLVVANVSTDPRDDPEWALRGWADARLPPPWRLALFGGKQLTGPDLPGVESVGRVPDDQLVTLLSRARIYLHTGRQEGFGLGIVESLQMGTAVVARRGSAVDELIPASAGFALAPDESPGPALRTLAETDTAALADQAWTAGSQFRWSRTADAVIRTLTGVLDHEFTEPSDGRTTLTHGGISGDAQ
jgi:glycosyltransferase involved in cell wall biosynthesis